MRKPKVALTEKQQQVLKLHRAGVPVREIADQMGVATQRIYQHLEKLRDMGAIK